VTGGTPLREYWRTHFVEPLAIDVWIGVPSEVVPRVAPVFPAQTAPPKGDLFYTAFLTAGSFTAQAFTSPRGLHSAAALNKPEALTAGFPGFGGVGTASGLAKFYAALANGGTLEGRRYFESETLSWMMKTLVQGPDRVLLLETAFSAGFMRDPIDGAGRKQRAIFGPSFNAFGQPGAGGSHAFADPDRTLSFAYVMNQMEPGVLPGPKSLRLVEALYD
jgi:CubicO group peptidase (beta-lactamase class C family)